MNVDQKLAAIRDVIQQDVGHRGLARDPNDNLLTATRSDFANACASIAEQRNAWIVIITGFFIPTADPPAGETDGPLGALFLARAFSRLGIRVAILTDPFCMAALDAGLQACNLGNEAELWEMPHRIAIERVGPAADGRCYTMRGRDITDKMRPAHRLFEREPIPRPAIATSSLDPFKKFVSIGIGDRGNEIGMGKISHETICRNIPNGDKTHCRTASDQLIVAGVSNWGGYALAAGVALRRGVQLPSNWFEPDAERGLLQLMVERGPLVDGVSGKTTATVDGLSWDSYVLPLVEIGRIAASAGT